MARALVLGISYGSILALLALGIVLVYKTTRVLNFAQGEFGTLAAYLAWLFVKQAHMPWGIGAILALVIMIGLGLVIERTVVRPMLSGPALSLTVASLGIMSLIGFGEVKVFGLSPRILPPAISGSGIRIAGVYLSPTRMIALALTGLLGIGLLALLKRTTFGLGVLAASQDPQTVRLMGIRLSRVSAFTWGTAAGLGALAGLIVLPSQGTFTPFAMTAFFVEALAAALLGGLTSLPGALVGGLGVGLLHVSVALQFPNTPGAIETGVLALILGVLLFRPRGLMGRTA